MPAPPGPTRPTGNGQPGSHPSGGRKGLGKPKSPAHPKKNSNGSPVPFFIQPPFDKRMLAIPMPGGSGNFGQLQRGFMIWDDSTDQLPQGYSNRAVVHFLYNPSAVAASFSADPTATQGSANLFRGPNDTASQTAPLTQSVSFALLYDRTFELWGAAAAAKNSSQNNPNDPKTRGVLVDILAMQQYTGMLATQTAISNKAGKGKMNIYNMQGPMFQILGWVQFGSVNGLNAFGFVSGWDYTITHWTQNMIPMRCVINVTFQLMPPPASEPVSATSAYSSWSLLDVQATTPADPFPKKHKTKGGR